MEGFLDDLSDVQRAAVCYNDGPSLVIAGAGSGKTRVLTYKIAKLVADGFKPSSILALTFTNKAAAEMKERVGLLVGAENAHHLWMGTFHSIFSKILRIESSSIGYTKDFSVYATDDTRHLLKSIVDESHLDKKIYDPKKLSNRISLLKNDLVTPEAYKGIKEYHDYDLRQKMPLFSSIYERYCRRCKEANAMDFDDLLLKTNILFRDFPNLLAKYQNIFKFILVDEYQDTNFAQFLIIQKLAKKTQRICVVGDDAQSIYSFRGAKIENILSFKENYPNCKIFKLEQNYRSTQNIVNAADSLIKKNKKQLEKNVFSREEVGAKIGVLSSYTPGEEASIVTKKLLELKREQGSAYSDFAILYRTNAQSRVFEDEFRKHNVPYKIWGSKSFYERKEVVNFISYFRLVNNPRDDEALRRIINYPARGIGDVTLGKIGKVAVDYGLNCWDVISSLEKYNLGINASTVSQIVGFKKLIDGFIAEKDQKDTYELASDIAHGSGIDVVLKKDTSPEGISNLQIFEELMNSIYLACSQKLEEDGEKLLLDEYLPQVALMTSQDDNDNADKVTLMTVHAAKGLEYKNVFIVGLEEELFPSSMSVGTADGIEEERRLFYVAITRARKVCFLSFSSSRMKNAGFHSTKPSRFLFDIDPQYLDTSECSNFIYHRNAIERTEKLSLLNKERPSTFRFNGNGRGGSIPASNSSSPVSFDSSKFRQSVENRKKLIPLNRVDGSLSAQDLQKYSSLKFGSLVLHPQFGVGRVTQMLDFGTPAPKVVVNFKSYGEKKLILKYAKLQIVKE